MNSKKVIFQVHSCSGVERGSCWTMESANGNEVTHSQNGSEEKIVVSVRVRPLNEKEVTRNDVVDWECINDDTVIYKSNFGPDRSLYPTTYTCAQRKRFSIEVFCNGDL